MSLTILTSSYRVFSQEQGALTCLAAILLARWLPVQGPFSWTSWRQRLTSRCGIPASRGPAANQAHGTQSAPVFRTCRRWVNCGPRQAKTKRKQQTNCRKERIFFGRWFLSGRNEWCSGVSHPPRKRAFCSKGEENLKVLRWNIVKIFVIVIIDDDWFPVLKTSWNV